VIEINAIVHWEGPDKMGQGQISTETGALKRYPNSFACRFKDDRICMALKFRLAKISSQTAIEHGTR
jgi:hypothetical protein